MMNAPPSSLARALPTPPFQALPVNPPKLLIFTHSGLIVAPLNTTTASMLAAPSPMSTVQYLSKFWHPMLGTVRASPPIVTCAFLSGGACDSDAHPEIAPTATKATPAAPSSLFIASALPSGCCAVAATLAYPCLLVQNL